MIIIRQTISQVKEFLVRVQGYSEAQADEMLVSGYELTLPEAKECRRYNKLKERYYE